MRINVSNADAENDNPCMQYLSKFSTVKLSKTALFDELSHCVNGFPQSISTCELLVGFAWGNEYYGDNDWQKETIALAELPQKIEALERMTQGKFGKDDLFITVAGIEFRFCHESHIHLCFNHFDSIVQQFYERWANADMLYTYRVFVALGANLGAPLKQLDAAASALNEQPQITCRAMSPVYQSVPHGDIEQPDYHNAVLAIDTTLSPYELLHILQKIEMDNGRERTERWGARTLDLDIILFGDLVLTEENLTIPHPRAYQREFVVKPLYDLDKNLIIPSCGAVADLVKTLPLENLTEIRHGITYHH